MFSLGAIAANIVGLVPWAGPKTLTAVLYLLLAVIFIGGPAGGVYVHMRAKMIAAEDTLNARWEAKLMKAEKDYAEMASAAIRAASEVGLIPSDDAELKRLCKQSPTCRDNGGSKN
jgi:hypothetical protein